MAELREIWRQEHVLLPGSWPGGSGGDVVVGTTTNIFATGTTILRSISFPSVRVSVGAPAVGTPPEGWWLQATMNWIMWYDTDSATGVPPFGYEPSVLYTGTLTPTFVASASAPTEYSVIYRGASRGFESRGQRKAPAGSNAYLCTGLRWTDPLQGLDSAIFPNVSVTVATTDIVVLGIPV